MNLTGRPRTYYSDRPATNAERQRALQHKRADELCRLRQKLAGFVANFAQEVMKGQWPMPVAGIRRPGSRTIRPQ